MKEKNIKVVILRPGKFAEITTVDKTLEAKQKIVGGLIETAHYFPAPIVLVCNESGKVDELPFCRAITDGDTVYELIYGTFFICAFEGGEFASLTDEQAEEYKALFYSPEKLLDIGGIYAVARMTDEF